MMTVKKKVTIRIPVFSLTPGSTYLVVEMLNKPGVMAGVLDVLRGMGVNILEGVHSRGESEDKGYWVALVQLPRTVKTQDIVRRLKRVDGVIDASIGAEIYGRARFPPVQVKWELVPDMPASIWRHLFLSMFVRGLRERLNEAAYAFLYHAGYEAGKLGAEYWAETLGTRDPKELVEAGLTILQRLGWFSEAKFLELDLKKPSVAIAVKGNQEAYGKKSDKPVCYFTSGIFSGYLSAVLGRPLRMEEVSCQARGDAQCVFVSTLEPQTR